MELYRFGHLKESLSELNEILYEMFFYLIQIKFLKIFILSRLKKDQLLKIKVINKIPKELELNGSLTFWF